MGRGVNREVSVGERGPDRVWNEVRRAGRRACSDDVGGVGMADGRAERLEEELKRMLQLIVLGRRWTDEGWGRRDGGEKKDVLEK